MTHTFNLHHYTLFSLPSLPPCTFAQDMFKGLAPVLSGFGIKVMKKMGWSEGQPLGKMGKGVTEPIPMSVKIDRAGQFF